MKLLIRDSKLDDVPEILEIYNYAIKNSVATFHTDEQTIQERIDWFNQHDKTHPILSMLSENRIVAWGSLSQWNPKPAYNGTVELTLYVHKDFRGRNYGKIMMESLITRARELNLHTIISLVTSSNMPSINLHQKFNFFKVGVLKESGFKFNEYHDVDIWQIIL